MNEIHDREDFSDERLNAFVDDELGSPERDEILTAIAGNAELGQRLCALRATKDMVRHAYDRVPSKRRPHARRLPMWGGALAASVMLVAGMFIGWYGHGAAAKSEPDSPLAWAAGLLMHEPARVLIHLDNSLPEHMSEALDLAEAYLAKASKARVEVVVNNGGLDLLREESTPFAGRIAALSKRHQLLAFVACGNAIHRYIGNGFEVTLVPEAVVAKTAIEHVADRVREGWTYVKI